MTRHNEEKEGLRVNRMTWYWSIKELSCEGVSEDNMVLKGMFCWFNLESKIKGVGEEGLRKRLINNVQLLMTWFHFGDIKML